MKKPNRSHSEVEKASDPLVPPRVNGTLRILQSTFRRGDDMIRCELGLGNDGTAYEIRTLRQGSPTEAVERFAGVKAAFARHGSIERALVADGWTLEGFSAHEVKREKTP